jgi:hypothetical protein
MPRRRRRSKVAPGVGPPATRHASGYAIPPEPTHHRRRRRRQSLPRRRRTWFDAHGPVRRDGPAPPLRAISLPYDEQPRVRYRAGRRRGGRWRRRIPPSRVDSRRPWPIPGQRWALWVRPAPAATPRPSAMRGASKPVSRSGVLVMVSEPGATRIGLFQTIPAAPGRATRMAGCDPPHAEGLPRCVDDAVPTDARRLLGATSPTPRRPR